MINDALLTPDEVAERLGLSPKSLATWRSEGRDLLPSFKVGNRVRYRASDLADFIAAGADSGRGGGDDDDGDDELDTDPFDDDTEEEEVEEEDEGDEPDDDESDR